MTANQAQRTPGPWTVLGRADLHGGAVVATHYHNAEQVASMLNGHDALVATLRELIAALDRGHFGQLDCDTTAALNRAIATLQPLPLSAHVDVARAALAAAEKQG